jgi:hypothetical protein
MEVGSGHVILLMDASLKASYRYHLQVEQHFIASHRLLLALSTMVYGTHLMILLLIWMKNSGIEKNSTRT